VPTAPDGPAPAGSVAVIERWLGAVRRADFRAAADAFALPAIVQNGGPVSRLRSRAELVVWNAALPCGAKVAEAGGARGYTVLTFTLTDREGGSCGSGVGAPAYGAIRVRDGRIAEWYRLPDPVAPPSEPSAPFV
jgi:limonene-1,2-epoxide hydrolase